MIKGKHQKANSAKASTCSSQKPNISVQNEMENSKRLIAMANYLKTYYKECLDNAQNKLELISKLPRNPSDDSLKELELLKDFAKEGYEDASQRYIYEKSFMDFMNENMNK